MERGRQNQYTQSPASTSWAWLRQNPCRVEADRSPQDRTVRRRFRRTLVRLKRGDTRQGNGRRQDQTTCLLSSRRSSSATPAESSAVSSRSCSRLHSRVETVTIFSEHIFGQGWCSLESGSTMLANVRSPRTRSKKAALFWSSHRQAKTPESTWNQAMRRHRDAP